MIAGYIFYTILLLIGALACIYTYLVFKKSEWNPVKILNIKKPERILDVILIDYNDAKAGEDEFELQVYNINKYFDSLTYLASKSKESIILLDYIEHGKGMDAFSHLSTELRKAHTTYLSAIENIVKSNKYLLYTRILQLPLNLTEEFRTRSALIEYVLKRLYSPTRRHISRMLGKDNFKLYIIPHAFRPYSEAIIDSTELFMELDRFDEDGIGKPDLIIPKSHTQGDATKRLIEYEYNTIQSILSFHQHITKHELIEAVNTISQEKHAQAKELDDLKRTLEAEQGVLEDDFSDITNS